MPDLVPQPKKKKNKKKKKSANANPPPSPPPTTTDSQNVPEKESFDICEVLPQEVGMTTFFNDVEVTMTHCGDPKPPVNEAAKKKKKKKKSKQQQQQNPNPPAEKTEEPVVNKSESPDAFIKFNADKLELVNHPEISVTLSKQPVNDTKKQTVESQSSSKPAKNKKKQTVEVQTSSKTANNNKKQPAGVQNFSKPVNNDKKQIVEVETLSKPVANNNKKQTVEVQTPKASEQKEESSEAVTSNKSKKKKKKKKKKNGENIENTAPTEPVPESTDSYSAPTYIKLPASGDNCVLLVSHESFSGDSSKAASNSVDKDSQSTQRVLIKSKDRIEESSVLQPSNSVPISSSVSIFPIPEKESTPQINSGVFSMDSSLQKVGDLVKMELNGNEGSETTPLADEEPKLTKAQLKAERRAKQEAQRAAKLAKSNENNPKIEQGDIAKSSKDTVKSNEKGISNVKVTSPDDGKDPSTTKESAATKQGTPETQESAVNKNVPKSIIKEVLRKDQVFSHLPQRKDVFAQKLDETTLRFHPSILEIGSRYSNGMLCGSNARCVAFLSALLEVIQDFKTPANKEFAKVLEIHLQKFLNFLNICRPLSVSITNAVKFLKHQINHLPKGIEEAKAKEELCYSINNFVKEEILLARKAICISASAKIVDGDTILVFAYSSVVQAVLCEAHDQNTKFHVMVVDSRPKREGLSMLRSLVKHGLRCSYISINAVSYVLRKVTKVMIGAHALLSNGCVMSRLGCKQLSLIAASYSLPVMVCCETYKFCERALTDSFVHNELGDPDELIRLSLRKNESLSNWQSLSSLQIYNILYDVTPSDLISVVITEKGILPCTSVPVVLRVKHAGL